MMTATEEEEDFVVVEPPNQDAKEEEIERVLLIRSRSNCPDDDAADGMYVLEMNSHALLELIQDCKVPGITYERYRELRKQDRDDYLLSQGRIEALTSAFEKVHVCSDCLAELDEWLEVNRDEAVQLKERLKRRCNGSSLRDESHAIIQFLRRENQKLRTKNQTLARECKSLKATNQKVVEANQAASKAFNTLNWFAKKQAIEVNQLKKLHRRAKEDLDAARSSESQRNEQLKEENAELKLQLEKIKNKYGEQSEV